MNFSIGQKVVCVDDSNIPSYWRNNVYALPVIGRVYVVRAVGEIDGEKGAWLIGMRGKIHRKMGHEIGYRASRFRPLEELKQEVADRQQLEEPIHVR